MSNELQTTAATGATVTAKLVNAAGTVVATVTLTEGPSTLYRGSVPGGTAAGTYSVIISDGYSTALGSLVWDGTAEVPAVRSELAVELARLDVAVSSVSGGGGDAAAIATAVLNATAGAGTVRDAATRLNALPEASPVLITPAAPGTSGLGRVYGYFKTPNGHVATQAKVQVMLVAPTNVVVSTNEGVVVSGRKVDVVTDDLGGLVLDLWRNDMLEPMGTYYTVTSPTLGVSSKRFELNEATADLRALLSI